MKSMPNISIKEWRSARDDSSEFFMVKIFSYVFFCFFAAAAYAQPINPWLADGINKNIQRSRQLQDGSQYDWSAQEVKRLRNTRFYGAIAMTPDNLSSLTWGGGDLSESATRTKALNACPRSNCRIVASFANTCGMVALPDGGKRIEDVFIGLDDDPEVAIDKAYRSCEQKFGKGRCHYLGREKSAKHTAFCVGYDYGIYSTK